MPAIFWREVGYWGEDTLHGEYRLQLDSEIQGTESAAGKLQWAALLTNESVAELGKVERPRKVGEVGTGGHLSSLHDIGSNLWFEEIFAKCLLIVKPSISIF